LVGTLESADADELVVRTATEQEPVTLRLADLGRVELSRAATGRAALSGVLATAAAYAVVAVADDDGRNLGAAVVAGSVVALPASIVAARKAGRGASVGRCMLLGVTLTGPPLAALASLASQDDDSIGGVEAFLVGFGVGAGIGALSGGVAGALGRERWVVTQPPRVRVGLAPVRRGLAAHVQVTF